MRRMKNMYKSNLLTVGQKAEIAEALHAAVCYTTRTKAHRHCAYFAFAGVGLLKELWFIRISRAPAVDRFA